LSSDLFDIDPAHIGKAGSRSNLFKELAHRVRFSLRLKFNAPVVQVPDPTNNSKAFSLPKDEIAKSNSLNSAFYKATTTLHFPLREFLGNHLSKTGTQPQSIN
jgi:hypothetical protein